MVAPGQAAGDGTARIAAAAVGNPPFTPLGLAKIAAYRARESDRRWSSSLVNLPLSRAQREGVAQRAQAGVGGNIEKSAGQPEIFQERPEVLRPRIATERKAPKLWNRTAVTTT